MVWVPVPGSMIATCVQAAEVGVEVDSRTNCWSVTGVQVMASELPFTVARRLGRGRARPRSKLPGLACGDGCQRGHPQKAVPAPSAAVGNDGSVGRYSTDLTRMRDERAASGWEVAGDGPWRETFSW